MDTTALETQLARAHLRFPAHGWLGLALVALFWTLNWSLEGLRTHWCFFPLWLGYCLTVDALAVRRRGSSLLTRSPARYAGLFAVSVPLWWLFEAINLRTRNWRYLGGEAFSGLEYAWWASLDFSTVVPAVLGSAELAAGFGFVRRLGRGPIVAPRRRTAALWAGAGSLMLAAVLRWPRYCFPFVWLSLYFIFEALNLWLGHRTLFDWTRRGDWRPVVSLWVGVLVCGFFWEMWNGGSYPKWVYDVPWVGFWRVFEMPLLGYLGYLPFALEVCAAAHLAFGLAGWARSDYLGAGLGSSDPHS